MRSDALRFCNLHALVDAVIAPKASVRSVREVDVHRGTDYFSALLGCGWPHYVGRFGLEDTLGDMFFEYELESCGPDLFDTSKYETPEAPPFTPTRDPALRARFGIDRIEKAWFRKPDATLEKALSRAGLGRFPGRRLTAEAQNHLRWALFAARRPGHDELLAYCVEHLLRSELRFRLVEAPLQAAQYGVVLAEDGTGGRLSPAATDAIGWITGANVSAGRLSAWLDWSYGTSHRWFGADSERLLSAAAETFVGPRASVPSEKARDLALVLLPEDPTTGLLSLAVDA